MNQDTNLFFKYVGASVIGMLICGSYSIVDTVFIGQASGKEGLAAIAVTWPVVMFLWSFGDLIGAGGAVLIAQSKGAGKPDAAQRLFSSTCFLLLACAVLLTSAAFPLLRPILRALGSEPELLGTSLLYTRIMTGGLVLSLFMSLTMNVIRNDGHPVLSMWIMVGGLLGNILLDWVFIFLVGMGAAGAAAASVTSQFFSVLVGVWYFSSNKTSLRFRFREIVRPARDDMKKILLTGLPIFGNMLSIIAMLYMHNAQSLKYGGVDGLAAYAVVSTIESLGSLLMTGIACGMQPLSAGMHGAGKFKRQNRFGNYGYRTAFVTGILLMLFSFAVHGAAPGWMGLADGTAAGSLAARAIMLSAPAFLFLGVIRVAGFYYQSTEQIGVSSWLIYGDSFLALPLCLYTLPLAFELNGVWLAMPVSRVLLAALLLYFWFGRRNRAVSA
ncbi:MAG: polysaccharide biosynthesis C-terminal domain-containing protein [Lentisphaeria bacterium]|nr:polysaccharide biosynthesis C-terminal domain-containing protein [Lentisphaeria bacterium]